MKIPSTSYFVNLTKKQAFNAFKTMLQDQISQQAPQTIPPLGFPPMKKRSQKEFENESEIEEANEEQQQEEEEQQQE